MMRKLLTLAILTTLTLSVRAQIELDDTRKMVGFGCFYEGRQTEPVTKVTKMLKKEKFKSISNLLTDGNSAEKYLAIISLEALANKQRYELSDREKELISKIKLSDEIVSVCSGCTYFEKVSMKDMLSREDFLGSQTWIERILNKE